MRTDGKLSVENNNSIRETSNQQNKIEDKQKRKKSHAQTDKNCIMLPKRKKE